MNKNADANINDLVDRLRKKMENETASKEEVVVEKIEEQSPEQLLKNLRAHMGEGSISTTSEAKENEYDISGFEISPEEVIESPQPPSETKIEDPEPSINTKEDETISTGSAESVTNDVFEEAKEPEEDDLPWYDDEPEANRMVLKDESIEKSNHDLTDDIHRDTPVEGINDELSDVESEEKPEEVGPVTQPLGNDSISKEETGENEEAVRKKVKLFVEKTLDPEEEFDYFARIDQRHAKDRSEEKQERPLQETLSAADSKDEAADASSILQKQSNSSPEEGTSKEQELPDDIHGELRVVVNTSDDKVPEIDSAEEQESETDEEALKGFFFTPPSSKKVASSTGMVPISSDAERLDDTDVNLLLALGKKRDLEDTIGFVRVREAKNNFYDPTEEEPVRRNVFAYNGQEYRSQEETDGIKTAYRKERKKIYRRLVCSVLLALVLLFLEHFLLLPIEIPYVSQFFANKLYYYAILLLFFLFDILVSFKYLLNGLRGFFTMRPTYYTPLSVAAFIHLLYSVGILLFLREESVMTYHFVFSVFTLFAVIGDALRLTKETLTFDIVSDPSEKFSLEKSEETAEISRERKVLRKKDLLVERVNFVGKYFSRTSHRPGFYTECFYEVLGILLAAVFAAVLSAAIYGNLSDVLTAFVFTVMLGIPLHHLLSVYPYARLAKKLYRHQSAIIGETVDTEYVGANTIYLDDMELFGHHGVSVSGLRIYNDEDFYNVLYHALAVFSQIEGPLRYVFEKSSHEIQAAKSVKLVNIYSNGIEAIVDEKSKVFIGNINFMRSNGFFPKKNEEDDKKVEDGELSILYMTISGVLCAKFYMKYTVTQHFEKFVTEMAQNNTKVGVRTLDPNVTEKMIAALRRGKETTISVIRPTLNDLIPLGKRSDSGIITAKGPHMISKILTECLGLKKIRRLCFILRISSIVVSLAATLALVLTTSVGYVAPLFLVAFHLLWLLPLVIYVKVKIR